MEPLSDIQKRTISRKNPIKIEIQIKSSFSIVYTTKTEEICKEGVGPFTMVPIKLSLFNQKVEKIF